MSREQYYRVNSAASPLDTMSLFEPVRQNRKVLMVDDDLLSQEKARSMALFQQYFRRDLTQHLADSGVSR
jgi:hypothetical protein